MKEYSSLVDSIANSLESYLFESIELIKNQMKTTIDMLMLSSNDPNDENASTSKNSNGNVNNPRQRQSRCGHFPNRLNFMISRIIETNKKRLNDEFKRKLDEVKLNLEKMAIDSSSRAREADGDEQCAVKPVKLDQIVDLDLFLDRTQKILEKFDAFFAEFKTRVQRSLRNNRAKQNNSHSSQQVDYTDIPSDTEIYFRSKFTSQKRLKKIFKQLKHDKYNNNDDEASEDSDEEANVPCRVRSYSESDADNLNVSDYLVYTPTSDRVSVVDDHLTANGYLSESDITLSNNSDDVSDDYNDATPDESDMDEDQNDADDHYEEEASEADVEEEERTAFDQREDTNTCASRPNDPDYILIDDDDDDNNPTPATVQPAQPQQQRVTNAVQMENKINENRALKRGLSSGPFLGQRVLALKDKFKHKWSFATIKRISHGNELHTTRIFSSNYSSQEKFYRFIINSKYYVVFDDEPPTNPDQQQSQFNDFLNEYTNPTADNGGNDSDLNNGNGNDSDASGVDSDTADTNSSSKKLKRRHNSGRATWQKSSVHSSESSESVKQSASSTSTGAHFSGAYIELDARSIAYLNDYDTVIPTIGYDKAKNRTFLRPQSRVVTLCQTKIADIRRANNQQFLFSSEYLSSGTIIELPSVSNYDRYLVLFDNGTAGYIKPTLVYPIFDALNLPADRLHPDHVKYLAYYFKNFPERKMVRLGQEATLEVYLNKKWFKARVLDVDCSLVKLELRNFLFSSSISWYSLWLFRGSFSLHPLYEDAMTKLKTSKDLTPYEEYIKSKLDNKLAGTNGNTSNYISIFASTIFPKYAPRMRTTKLNNPGPNQVPKGPTVLQGQIKHLDMKSLMRDEIIEFEPHPCSSACVAKWENRFAHVKSVNPLLMPALHGWQRHICHQSKNQNGSKKWVNYVAPCGRMLRSTGEVDKYLFLTDSKLTIDMFSFDYFIHTDREFEANGKFLKIGDITNGKENVFISCVNCVDDKKPEPFEYSARRIAMEGVPLVIDESKTEGCGCEDGCRDRMRCACWRKTFEATMFANNQQTNTNVGYRGRRLADMINTGIFECNSNCKCDYRCSNRVVQNGISVRLQLFKTPSKGWGLRCLDDIPKGTFICTYAGQVMTEEQSDVRGKELGDEYFAELDFVECLRKLRDNEGSTSNEDDDDENRDNNNNNNDDDDDEMNDNSNGAGANCLSKNNNTSSNNNDESKKSNYQRPKQQQQHQQSSKQVINENEYILVDSDEENINFEQTSCVISKTEFDYNKKRMATRQLREKRMTFSVHSNRFFTNSNNPFFVEEFLKDSSVYIMDAKICGNIGRFFNHSCSPNIFVQNVFVDTYDLKFPWIAFFALNSIKAGTELCWDYNYTIDSVQGRVLLCHCSSSNCRGRLL